jgi:hypothetical protein
VFSRFLTTFLQINTTNHEFVLNGLLIRHQTETAVSP